MKKIIRYFTKCISVFAFIVALCACCSNESAESQDDNYDIIFTYSDLSAPNIWSVGNKFVLTKINDDLAETFILDAKGDVEHSLPGATGGDVYDGIIHIVDSVDNNNCYTLEGVQVPKEMCPPYNPLFVLHDISASDILTPIKTKNEKCGYINRQGILTINPQYYVYENGGRFSEGKAVVSKDQKEWNESTCGMLDYSGAYTPLVEEDAFPYGEGFCQGRIACSKYVWVYNEQISQYVQVERYNFITAENKKLFPNFSFLDVKSFSEGLAAVKTELGWKYINLSGETVIPAQYEEASQFEDGHAAVMFPDGNIAVIDMLGTVVSCFQTNYSFSGEYHGGYLLTRDPDGARLLDANGNVVSGSVPFYSIAWENGRWHFTKWDGLNGDNILRGIMLSEGNVLLSSEPVQIYHGICVIKQNKEYLLVDMQTGEKLLAVDDIGTFSEGLAPAKRGRYWGYIDVLGEWVISPQFLDASHFCNGTAHIRTQQSNAFIANPILFDSGWVQDEASRATSLGLLDGISDSGNSVTYNMLKQSIRNIFAAQQKFQKACGIEEDCSQAELGEEEICNRFLSIYDPTSLVTRQEMAKIFAEVAEFYGKATEEYRCFYNDIEEIDRANLYAVSYISSLQTFNVLSNNFKPNDTITTHDFSCFLLRFFVAMQD